MARRGPGRGSPFAAGWRHWLRRDARCVALQMITEFGEERQRRLILDYFGGNAQAAPAAADADLRLAGLCRRFRSRRPAFPHPGLVRQQHPGDRAVEHGFALPGAACFSLRAADVAGIRDEPAGGHGVAARRRRCGDVAVYARLSAGLRADPGRCRRDDRLDCAALVLSDPAGDDRAGAAIRRHRRPSASMSSSSISTIRPGPPRATSCFGRAVSMRSTPAAVLANNWADFSVNPAVRPMADALPTVAQRARFRADLM